MDRAGLDYRVRDAAAAAARLSSIARCGRRSCSTWSRTRSSSRSTGSVVVSHRRRRRSRGARRSRTPAPASRRTSCRASSNASTASKAREGRSHEGSGIGLALVQELVKLHGGELVGGEPGRAGQTFRVVDAVRPAHLPPDQIGPRRRCGGTGVSGVVRRGSDAVAAGPGMERRTSRAPAAASSGRPAGRHWPRAARRRQRRHARLRAAAARPSAGTWRRSQRAGGARRGAGARARRDRHRRDDAGARRLRAAAGAACRRGRCSRSRSSCCRPAPARRRGSRGWRRRPTTTWSSRSRRAI